MVDNTPFSPQLTLTNPAGPFSNPLLGIQNPFPAPVPPAKDAPFPGPVQVISNDPSGRYHVPTAYQWNLTVEHQLAADWLVRAGYVGSHASHIRTSTDLNPAVYIPGSTLGPDQRRLFPGYANIYIASNSINSSYNALQVTVEKRFSHNFSVLANYTFAKSLDDLPSGIGVTSIGGDNSVSVLPWYFPNANSLDRGPSEFDLRHVLSVSYLWHLPSLSGANRLMRGALGDWELSGIITAHTGDPLTLVAGVDRSQSALGVDRPVYLSGSPYLSGPCQGSAPCVNWLNPNSFGLPDVGTFGNTGKGSLRGPGFFNWDMGIFKTFPMTERWRLQLRAEAFNALNHTNFQDPGNSLAGGGFGQIYSANSSRIGQLALKLLF
jgi:hypothetical protein